MPRVIVQTPEPTEGAAAYVFEMVKALHAASTPVVLFCPSNFDYLGYVRAAGIPVVLSPSRPVSLAGLPARLWRNVRWLVTTAALQFQNSRPGDVLHFEFLLHLPLGLVFMLLARMRSAKIVLKAHDPLPHKWRLPPGLKWFELLMLKTAYGLCDVVIVHNQVGKAILTSQFQCPEARIAVIPHGPLAPRVASPSYPDLKVLRLLLFGSIRENKGVHLAIEAVQKLNGNSNVPVRLTIAGPVTSAHTAYWDGCKEMIQSDAGFIDVLDGYIADADVPALFARHHAVLMPYLDFFSESGVASLALSNERPLIATDSGGLGELLEASGGGIAIEAGSVEAVMRAVRTALEISPEKLEKMGLAGARYLQASRSWKTIAEKTQLIYAELSPPERRTEPSRLGTFV